MSEQKIFIAGFIPDDKSVEEFGARRVATSFNAKDIKHAQAKASFLFMEEYPGAQDAAYKTLICEDTPEVTCRPARGVWDENFLYENDWDEVLGYPVARCEEPQPVEFEKLSTLMQNAVLVKFGTTDITKDMLPAALELTQDEAGTFEGHIVEAINKTPEINSMYPERKLQAIAWVKEKCAATKKWPEIKAELHIWKKRLDKERKDADENRARDEVTTQSTTTAYSGRTYQHTYRTLNKEIAYALWAGDIDPGKTDPSISRWADGIIANDREDWKRWSAVVTAQEHILAYDRPTIFNMVHNAPAKDIHHFPDSLKRYVTEYLQKNGVFEGDHDEKTKQESQNTDSTLANAQTTVGAVDPKQSTDKSEETPEEGIERQGPFYYRTAAGDKIGRANKLPKLQEVISQGCVEITQEEYQARKTGTYTSTDSGQKDKAANDEQVEVKNHGNGHFSIDGLLGEQPSAGSETSHAHAEEPSNEVVKQEIQVKADLDAAQPVVDFQSVGASLEKDLQDKSEDAQDNLKIWRSVMRTDPRFTKQMTGTGFEGTSINAEYMIMRATEIFGPIGSRWGFEILEDRMIPGAPFSEAIYEDKKFIGNRMLRDGDGTLLFEQNHSMKIRLWYQTEADEGSVHAYGATPYMYKTKNGIKCDGEAQKKSLTDALKKALSLLGFSADVWLGLYDLAEYQAENTTEFAIKNASDKAEDVTRLRTELDEKLTRVASVIENAVSTNEAKKVFDTLAREVEVHRKAAEAKGDMEHAKYLSGRLRRLSQIKDQRIQKLTENQEQSA